MKNVMIVDDNRLARLILRRMISEGCPDWSITEAVDGEEALRKAVGMDLAAAILDVNMPGIDGTDVAERLLEMKPDLPITLLTANVHAAVRERADSLGIGFMDKPPDRERVLAFLSVQNGDGR